MDPADVTREMAEFRPVYRTLRTDICWRSAVRHTEVGSSRLETNMAVRMKMNRTMIWWYRTGSDIDRERIDSQRCMTDQSFFKLFRSLHGSRIQHHMQGACVAGNYKQQWWESDERAEFDSSRTVFGFCAPQCWTIGFLHWWYSFWERCSRMYRYR